MGYDNLKLEKGMYRQEGMNFTQVLESLDPSENYRGTALEGTDAFQRQLKRFGIRAKGEGSSPVEKFFRTMDSAVLFPEYISRTVRQGMEENENGLRQSETGKGYVSSGRHELYPGAGVSGPQ